MAAIETNRIARSFYHYVTCEYMNVLQQVETHSILLISCIFILYDFNRVKNERSDTFHMTRDKVALLLQLQVP